MWPQVTVAFHEITKGLQLFLRIFRNEMLWIYSKKCSASGAVAFQNSQNQAIGLI